MFIKMLQNFFNKNFMFLLRPYDIINSDLIPVKWMIGVLLCLYMKQKWKEISLGFGLRLMMQMLLVYFTVHV